MKYEEFLEIAKAHAKANEIICGNDICYIDDIREKFFKPGNEKTRRYGTKHEVTDTPRYDFIAEAWIVGGVRGGSCWESSNPRPYSTDEKEPRVFKGLDRILMEVCPKISFLHYREIESLIERGEGTDYQYYGNRDDYEYRFVKLKSLHEKLTSLNLF